MARTLASQGWPVLLRNARNISEQIDALRALKNEIVGHALKKEMVVTMGLVEPVVRMSFNKSSSRQDGKSHDHIFAARPLEEDEMVRLQGLQVLGSIALGGSAFLSPLHYAAALPAILTNLDPSSNPSQLVLAALRALSNLVDSAVVAASSHPLSTNSIADALFVRPHLGSLARIISQISPTTIIQSQISLVASIINRICREEYHQQSLAASGVLDALAVKLASFVVADGLVIPGAEIVAHREGLREYIPAAAPSTANLSVVLGAVAVIISDSKFRASQLVYNPSILAVFPSISPPESIIPHNSRAAWNSFNSSSLGARQSQLSAIDYLLPFVPQHQVKSAQSSAFPPLGTSNSREHLPLNGRNKPNHFLDMLGESPLEGKFSAEVQDTQADAEEPESPFIAYLILILRLRDGMERLMAAHVLTVLYRAGLANKARESALELLVVPLLVQMLDESTDQLNTKDGYTSMNSVTLDWIITETAPSILALLITDNEYLQRAAFNNRALNKLSKLLKIAYDPVPESAEVQHWSPTIEDAMEDSEPSQFSRLGDRGQPALLVHKIKVRESVLKAIAALLTFSEEYRQAAVDHGIIPYIIESLNSNPKKPTPKINNEKADKSEKKNDPIETETNQEGYGVNPVEVLIAACGATRALTRSIKTMRTTFVDNGLAMPIFPLLSHPDIEVQIAATATACNLMMDVSPMREALAEYGVIKILCEHAHSMNAKLRLNATWALKHFVIAIDNERKRLCLEELGQGWLVQLICDDTEDEALASKSSNQRNAASFNDGEEMDMDQSEEQAHLQTSNSRPSSSRSKSLQYVEMKLAALRDAETNPARKARKDDIAVQEQGLDFIRNLIGGVGQGSTPECTEMIDYLFSCLGQDRVFEILASKLRPKVINPFRRVSGIPEPSKIIPPQTEIVVAVAYILVHIAASIPAHRQLIMAQTDLLKLLVPQFHNPSPQVRAALCFFIANITWIDDSSDISSCAQRVRVLKDLGIFNKVEALEHDPELDVRERAKHAMLQMTEKNLAHLQ